MSQPPAAGKVRLLDQVRGALRVRHMSPRTERTYVHWIRRYILFHKKRHPLEMAEPEINSFLTHLATARRVSPATQTQALCALHFLYRHVLGREIGDLDVVRARRRPKIPVVLTRDEVRSVLDRFQGVEKPVKGQEDIDRLADEPGHWPFLAELEIVKRTDLIGTKDWLVHGVSPLLIGF